jgi:hypothetical protein
MTAPVPAHPSVSGGTASRTWRPIVLRTVVGAYVCAFALLLVLVYRVPWGGLPFDVDAAGSVADWSTCFLTGVGLVGLWVQLEHLRRDQRDVTLKDANALMTRVEQQSWDRAGELDGVLASVYVDNFGSWKAMNVSVVVRDRSGALLPEDWTILRQHNAVVGPQERGSMPLLIVHVPLADRRRVFDELKMLAIDVTWTDPYGGRLTMLNNGPATQTVLGSAK